ncbi:MAG: lysylphosphatidylglycerol synthase transmembrane domain-containing protein [Promethearchaeota archaeon]
MIYNLSEAKFSCFLMRWKLRFTFLLIFTGFTIYFLFQLTKKLDLNLLESIFSDLRWEILVLAFSAYLGKNLLRAFRFKKFYQDQIPLKKAVPIDSYINLLNQTIPYRLGELSHVYFATRQGIPVEKSVGVFAVVKLFDFVVSSAFFVFLYALFYTELIHPEVYGFCALIIGTISAIGVLFFVFLDRFQDTFEKIANRYSGKRATRITAKITNLISSLKATRSSRNLYRLVFLSVVIRLVQLMSTVLIFFALNEKLPVSIILLNDLFLTFAAFIPLSIIARLGYFEYTFTVLIQIQGIDLSNAYVVGFAWHVVTISFIVLYFGLGLILDWVKSPRQVSGGTGMELFSGDEESPSTSQSRI